MGELQSRLDVGKRLDKHVQNIDVLKRSKGLQTINVNGSPENDLLKRLENTLPEIEKTMGIFRAPSISIGVLHEGKIIFRRSFGFRDVGANLKANSDTSYLLGSCSKMLTSTALGVLAESGKISWNDTIQSHLPGFAPVEDPNIGDKATIIDACRHTTGLANPNVIFMGPEGTLSIKGKDHLDMVNALPTSNSSGQRFGKWWYYSNAVFGLMGQVIEAASGMRYSKFLQDVILAPLNLKHTLISGADVEANSNVAHPYVQLEDGTWSRIGCGLTDEDYTATLACMGIRSSVNDMLVFLGAVMSRYDEESRPLESTPPPVPSTANPLRQVKTLWNHWWTRPRDDGFQSDTAYLLGWYRTTMPSGALGLTAYNHYGDSGDKTYLKYIIGKKSTPRTVYGHNGIANGSVASAYVIPSSRSAVVALSNASDAGDAAEIATQILLQALFDLKPHVNLVPSAQHALERGIQKHKDMISAWEKERNVFKYSGKAANCIGTYVGLGVSLLHLVPSITAGTGVAVIFGDNGKSKCDLEPYNKDAVSFLPLKYDERLARGMLDWDYYKVGIFEFVLEAEEVVAFWWQWDQYDWPGLWVRRKDGMSEEQVAAAFKKYGRFRTATPDQNDLREVKQPEVPSMKRSASQDDSFRSPKRFRTYARLRSGNNRLPAYRGYHDRRYR